MAHRYIHTQQKPALPISLSQFTLYSVFTLTQRTLWSVTPECVSYLRGTLEVHPWHREGGDVHGDAPIQVERAHNEEVSPTHDGPTEHNRVIGIPLSTAL